MLSNMVEQFLALDAVMQQEIGPLRYRQFTDFVAQLCLVAQRQRVAEQRDVHIRTWRERAHRARTKEHGPLDARISREDVDDRLAMRVF